MTKHAHENGDGPAATADPDTVRVVHMHKKEPTEVDWLWDGLIPRGKIATLAGDPGVGKSTLTCQIAARVTRGQPLPFSETPAKPESVLIISAEDADEDTIRPRLDRAGADVRKVKRLEGLNGEDGEIVPWDFSRRLHRRRLREMIERYEPGLVIVDPLNQHLGGANVNRDGPVRQVLGPLAQIARETHVALLGIRHLNKDSSMKAIYRAIGSIAFTATVRSEMLVGANPDDEEQRALVQIKNNLADLKLPIGYELNDGSVAFTGLSDLTVEDLLKGGSRSAPKLEKAAKFLLRELDGGEPVPFNELLAKAEAEGVSESTLRRAEDGLSVRKEKVGFNPSHWVWYLPEDHQI